MLRGGLTREIIYTIDTIILDDLISVIGSSEMKYQLVYIAYSVALALELYSTSSSMQAVFKHAKHYA